MGVLSASGLAKSYQGRFVVQDVSLSIHTGEIVGLLGPNGAGKTTSFYMIVGLVSCDRGLVKLDDRDITALPMHARSRLGIGYLPQEASIFRKLSVKDNILAVLQMRNDLSNKERDAQCEHLLAEFNIRHLANDFGISLSGGERRRVEIARAVAMAPKFILLDEPFAGVDPISVVDIKRIIRHLSSLGIGILITDHNVRETLDICEKAYIVHEGQIFAQGEPDELLRDQNVRSVYLGEEFKL